MIVYRRVADIQFGDVLQVDDRTWMPVLRIHNHESGEIDLHGRDVLQQPVAVRHLLADDWVPVDTIMIRTDDEGRPI